MSGISTVEAWTNAEEQCYRFLCGILSATHNADAFKAELAEGFQLDAQRGMWTFSIGGETGEAPLDYDWNHNLPGGGGTDPLWKLPALFHGIWSDREVAIRAAGVIVANTPIRENSLTGVFRFRMRRAPSIVRAVYKIAADQATGGDVRVWKLEIPMEVIFRKAP